MIHSYLFPISSVFVLPSFSCREHDDSTRADPPLLLLFLLPPYWNEFGLLPTEFSGAEPQTRNMEETNRRNHRYHTHHCSRNGKQHCRGKDDTDTLILLLFFSLCPFLRLVLSRPSLPSLHILRSERSPSSAGCVLRLPLLRCVWRRFVRVGSREQHGIQRYIRVATYIHDAGTSPSSSAATKHRGKHYLFLD